MIKKSRFTLLELLIVIAIIAILVSLLLPALKRTKGITKRSYCINNFKQACIAHSSYSDDNNEYIVFYNTYDTWNPAYWQWFQYLSYCGYYSEKLNGSLGAIGAAARIAEYLCPSINQSDLNYYDCWAPSILRGYSLLSAPKKRFDVKKTAACLFWADVCNSLDGTGNYGHNTWNLRDTQTYNQWRGWLDFRHLDTTNILFFDGHVESRKSEDIPQGATETFWCGE